MNKKDGIFYAKILLFGEYSIMCDSMALTVPYTHFKGELSFINEDKYTDLAFAEESSKSLREFYTYLNGLKSRGELIFDFHLDRFKTDLDEGLYFESSIPQGFGIGSSGALVAAVYEKYAADPIKEPDGQSIAREDLNKLKKIFSQMESFFHGVSSGMDPLNCYMRNPLLIKPDQHIVPVGIPREFSNNGGIFLINTGNPGKTGPLVSMFFDRCKEEGFMNLIKNEMIPFTNSSIEAIITGEFSEFFANLKKLSRFLLSNLKPMIPAAFLDIWQEGIDTGSYYLKLCGSGGGGFLLGFTEDLQQAQRLLASQNVEIIPVSKFH
ncbi:MAG: mevalonate kinase [Bacteroidales bacterium]